MSNIYKEKYQILDRDRKNQFLLWATGKYERKATSIENHWIGKGAVPDQWQNEVLSKLEELTK